MKLIKEKKLWAAIMILYWVGLFITTHIPVPNWVRQMGVSDKFMHFGAYMALGLLIWLTISFDEKVNWRSKKPYLVLLVLLIYALIDEGSQHFIPGRSFDLMDIASDMLGAAAALLIATFISGYYISIIVLIIFLAFLPGVIKSRL